MAVPADKPVLVKRFLLVAAVLSSFACTPREAEDQPNVEERVLLAQLRRDPYIRIDQTWRDGLGNLVVETSQGAVRRRYLLAPDTPSDQTLRLRRIDDSFHVPGPAPAKPGMPQAKR